jgi:hypothetical protein
VTNTMLYLVEALHSVLRARSGTKKSGHWVVFETMIDRVDIIAVAYAWSQRSVSHFMSNYGNTARSSVFYRSNFKDDFGNFDFKFLPRPQICHFIHKYLPLIDEHNKKMQNVLGLERKWPTKDCWFRLLVTIVGMCVVDMQRLYRHEKTHTIDCCAGSLLMRRPSSSVLVISFVVIW